MDETADVQQPAPAATDEHRLWQNFADALNALADYGLDPLAGTVSPALVDAGDVIHGGGVRAGGQRLCWLGAGGNDDHDFGSKWIVEDRGGAQPLATSDTLPAWLYQRFGRSANTRAWGDLDDADQSYWAHHAAAVRRAVARGGFKAAS